MVLQGFLVAGMLKSIAADVVPSASACRVIEHGNGQRSVELVSFGPLSNLD
jgi:hypothetical protein